MGRTLQSTRREWRRRLRAGRAGRVPFRRGPTGFEHISTILGRVLEEAWRRKGPALGPR